jgi:GTP cyclohydrolase I
LFGLGTLAAVVDAFARRLSLQEAIGEQVVQALVDHGGAQAAYCELRLVHGCVVARGARQASTELISTARLGAIDMAELSLALGQRGEGAP